MLTEGHQDDRTVKMMGDDDFHGRVQHIEEGDNSHNDDDDIHRRIAVCSMLTRVTVIRMTVW